MARVGGGSERIAMTPDEFKLKMIETARSAKPGSHEYAQLGYELIAGIMRQLGYTEGIDVYEANKGDQP